MNDTPKTFDCTDCKETFDYGKAWQRSQGDLVCSDCYKARNAANKLARETANS